MEPVGVSVIETMETNPMCCLCNKVIPEDEGVITYYDPKSGKTLRYKCEFCRNKERVEEWEKTGKIDAPLLMFAYLRMRDRPESSHLHEGEDDTHARGEVVEHEPRRTRRKPFMTVPQAQALVDLNTRLTVAIKDFERRFWVEGGFFQFNKDAKERGFRADKDGRTVLTYTMAGRTMVTISPSTEDGTSISVVYDESSPEGRSGLQTVYGTEAQALSLLAVDVKATDFRPDRDVSIV